MFEDKVQSILKVVDCFPKTEYELKAIKRILALILENVYLQGKETTRKEIAKYFEKSYKVPKL